jgi:hypothetical protein
MKTGKVIAAIAIGVLVGGYLVTIEGGVTIVGVVFGGIFGGLLYGMINWFLSRWRNGFWSGSSSLDEQPQGSNNVYKHRSMREEAAWLDVTRPRER